MNLFYRQAHNTGCVSLVCSHSPSSALHIMSGAKLVDACHLCLLMRSHTVDLLTESHTHTSPACSVPMLYHALQQACVCSESSSMLVTGQLMAHLYFLLAAPTEFPESRWLWPSIYFWIPLSSSSKPG